MDDHHIPPVRMDQVMSVAANMVAATINAGLKEDDDVETKTVISLINISVFLHQLLMRSNHKDKVVKILEAIIVELNHAQSSSASE